MAELEVLRDDPAVLISDDGLVAGVGKRLELQTPAGCEEVPVEGVLFPGFVDSHTHAVFGVARTADHERRARGTDYKQIAAEGGGILSSVRSVRKLPRNELTELTSRRLKLMLSLGSTTVEVKSGYGLALEPELKQLEVIQDVSHIGPDVVPTFLGAHEIPEEFGDRPNDYVDVVINEMMPVVEERGLARFCDVFCEPGVFTVDQSRRILQGALDHRMKLKLHADELDGSGGAELAVELGAVSADHLAAISSEGIKKISQSQTLAVFLPGTLLFLGRNCLAPAREIIDKGGAVALATDFNPGSSPGLSLPLMGMMAVSQLRMLPAEAVTAITVNGAAAVDEAHTRGQIAPGFRADLVLASVRDWRELVYWYGTNLVSRCWVKGSPCDSDNAAVN
ncbi:MAG: imidazolonepropionase [Gemmatimonadales bacterium]